MTGSRVGAFTPLQGPAAAVTLLLDDAENALGAVRFEPLADRLTGVRLGLTEVADRAEPQGLGAAGVEHGDRDARRDRLLDHGTERTDVGGGDRDPVDLLVDRGLDQL